MSFIDYSFYPRSNLDVDFRTLHDLFDIFDPLDLSLVGNRLDWIVRPDWLMSTLADKDQLDRSHKYRIAVDIRGINKQSVRTYVSDDKAKLIVTAKEGEIKDPNAENYTLREIKRTYTLPSHAEIDKMASYMAPNGKLIIEIPLGPGHKEQSKQKQPKQLQQKIKGKSTEQKLPDAGLQQKQEEAPQTILHQEEEEITHQQEQDQQPQIGLESEQNEFGQPSQSDLQQQPQPEEEEIKPPQEQDQPPQIELESVQNEFQQPQQQGQEQPPQEPPQEPQEEQLQQTGSVQQSELHEEIKQPSEGQEQTKEDKQRYPRETTEQPETEREKPTEEKTETDKKDDFKVIQSEGPIEEILPRIINGKQIEMRIHLPQVVDTSKVRVTCKDNDLVVIVRDEQEGADTESEFFYYRRTPMPDETDFKALKCTLEGNRLTIRAPVKQHEQQLGKQDVGGITGKGEGGLAGLSLSERNENKTVE